MSLLYVLRFFKKGVTIQRRSLHIKGRTLIKEIRYLTGPNFDTLSYNHWSFKVTDHWYLNYLRHSSYQMCTKFSPPFQIVWVSKLHTRSWLHQILMLLLTKSMRFFKLQDQIKNICTVLKVPPIKWWKIWLTDLSDKQQTILIVPYIFQTCNHFFS